MAEATSENQVSPGLGDVVVATDMTRGAERALERALSLPLAPGAQVTLLHVIEDGKGDRDARRALESAAAAARRLPGAPPVRIALERGKPFVEIIRHARGARAELVVIGRHGERAFRDLFLGSTAERVIRKGETPTLVVHGAVRGAYRRPVVATDLSETSARALALALRIAPGVPIAVVHAYEVLAERTLQRVAPSSSGLRKWRRDEARRAAAGLAEFLRGRAPAGALLEPVVRRGDPRGAICGFAARHRADLIALGTHGRTGLGYVLIGSVAEAVVRAAQCDVLVARPAALAFSRP
jgi:universal stress protein E